MLQRAEARVCGVAMEAGIRQPGRCWVLTLGWISRLDAVTASQAADVFVWCKSLPTLQLCALIFGADATLGKHAHRQIEQLRLAMDAYA